MVERRNIMIPHASINPVLTSEEFPQAAHSSKSASDAVVSIILGTT